jgi:hypothetical protein
MTRRVRALSRELGRSLAEYGVGEPVDLREVRIRHPSKSREAAEFLPPTFCPRVDGWPWELFRHSRIGAPTRCLPRRPRQLERHGATAPLTAPGGDSLVELRQALRAVRAARSDGSRRLR